MIVALTGAGVSTDSGIPDFRSPGGVWERFDMNEFTIQRFLDDPAGFWEQRAKLIAAMDYLDAKPNAIHHLLARGSKRGLRVITQNIDGLHQKAGTEHLLELHGNGAQCICRSCKSLVPTPDAVAARKPGHAARCVCGGLLKPNVILFGEPVTAYPEAQDWVAEADALWVMGTSLSVHPAASLVDVALAHGVPVTILNREPTPYDARATVRREPVADVLAELLDEAGLLPSVT